MKILIADDHELFREGLRQILEQMDPAMTIVEAADFQQAIDAAEREQDIDIVLMDITMPGGAWNDTLPRLKEILPDRVPVIIVSASDDRRQVLETITLGAAGFIPKTSSSRVMMSALQLVLAGGVYLPPALLQQGGDIGDGASVPHGADALLTPRQREVLALLGKGQANKEIARALQLAEGTVKLHVTAILKTLGVNNRTRAVVAAAQLGLAAKD
ncbi:MAG: response regulator transcription factor [Rhodospirillaceae bacterium]|nr:response regulator transcription factor [Rhodospirillales bacterium]